MWNVDPLVILRPGLSTRRGARGRAARWRRLQRGRRHACGFCLRDGGTPPRASFSGEEESGATRVPLPGFRKDSGADGGAARPRLRAGPCAHSQRVPVPPPRNVCLGGEKCEDRGRRGRWGHSAEEDTESRRALTLTPRASPGRLSPHRSARWAARYLLSRAKNTRALPIP